MTPNECRESYRENMDAVGETIVLRRYTGTGVGRVPHDTNVRARVAGYSELELVGGIQQGDRRLIVLVEDLENAGFAMPVTPNDKIVLRGTMISILSIDDSTRRIQGELIALEIQARG
jgi:hypothetical protein